jgi:hypothetical protein
LSYNREITDDPITEYLKKLFEENMDSLSTRWFEFERPDVLLEHDAGKGRPAKVQIDLQEQLTYTPSIEIVFKNSENNIYSIGTQEQHFFYDIICTTNNNHPEFSSQYIRVFSNSIFNLLNDFEHRAFSLLPKYNFQIYYSEAARIDYGYRRGKGLRSGRIEWMCKLLKPNRQGLPA